MSSSVTKWIREYFIGIGTEYGGILDSKVPPTKDKKKCQVVQFLTFQGKSNDNCVWAVISDKAHYLTVKFTPEALDEYDTNSNNRGKRLTECKGALILITNFTPCFRRVAVQEGKPPSSERTISLEVNFVKVLGSYNESLWGNPASLEKDHELGPWIIELRKENGNINLFRDRQENDDKGVQRQIDKFNDFPVAIASPAHVRASPQLPKKQHTSRPKTSKRVRTLMELYNKKWKKQLRGAHRLFENSCIPQEVKVQLTSVERTPKRATRNRDPLNFDSSQAIQQASSAPHTPRQTTPLPEEWPPSQINGDAPPAMVDRDPSNDGKYPPPMGTNSLVEDSEPEEETNEAGLLGKTCSIAEKGSPQAEMPIVHQPPSAHGPELPLIPNSPASMAGVQITDLHNDAPNYSIVATLGSPALLSSPQDHRIPVTTGEYPQSPPATPNNDQSLSLAAGLTRSPPTPAQRITRHPISSSQQIDSSLPPSSIPLPSTLNKASDDPEMPLPPHGPSHYINMVRRKVPTPKQGPPVATYRYKQSDGKILVPASDGSASQSQSQPFPQLHGNGNLSGQADQPQQEVALVQVNSNGAGSPTRRSQSLPPIEFISGDNTNSHGSNSGTGGNTTEADEEKDELDVHGNPDSHDADPDDKLISKKLNQTLTTNLTTRPSSVSRGKMLEVPDRKHKNKRLRSPSIEIISPPRNRPQLISSTHNPKAWVRPSFQTRNKDKGKELPATGVGNASGRKRDVSAMSTNGEEDRQANKRQKIHHDNREQNDRKSSVVTADVRHRRELPDPKPHPKLSKVASSSRQTSRTRNPKACRSEEGVDVDGSDALREVNQSRRKMAGLNIAFNILPLEGISLLTQRSVEDILLRTGRSRHKEAIAHSLA